MSAPSARTETKAADMRRRFDETFASPATLVRESTEPLLAIVVGGERFAVRLRHIAAFAAARNKIVAVPSSVPELLGITAVRGAVVPLFSLASLLGVGGSREVRWIVLVGGGPSAVALGFDGFDGYLQVHPEEIFPAANQDNRRHVRESTRHDGLLRGVIDLASLVEKIRRTEIITNQ